MAANKKTAKNRIRAEQPPPEANGMPAATDTPAQNSAASRRPKPSKAKTQPKAKKEQAKKEKAKKTSALDAAARVLGEAASP
jgi:hypothetical protein